MKGKPSYHEYVLYMSYFESSWATSIESCFHGLCVRRRKPLAAIESIVQISNLDQAVLAYHPSYFSPTVYTAHLWEPCQQIQESLIEYVSAIFSEELSTPALSQPSLGWGTKHKQALRDVCRNASYWTSTWNTFMNQQAYNFFKSSLIETHLQEQMSVNESRRNPVKTGRKEKRGFLVIVCVNKSQSDSCRHDKTSLVVTRALYVVLFSDNEACMWHASHSWKKWNHTTLEHCLWFWHQTKDPLFCERKREREKYAISHQTVKMHLQ